MSKAYFTLRLDKQCPRYILTNMSSLGFHRLLGSAKEKAPSLLTVSLVCVLEFLQALSRSPSPRVSFMGLHLLEFNPDIIP
ncbi:hypothetical protein HYPBUDRAFT_182561 [Hyphopichia burtonii NRRL Y-1933]|uniref:Uncharacterized protein n=1 Tax=Hyphopichia burtonii NRRL Y-1933 TaxID=984485 RepID=A0A1E4RTA2_9ASCO|nr:hypothetical protein HYPBUDRAFT_182561 [Hyphopichia burtonii NRRL Y-1933]ODV70499.1 hypothetical protein HYPBUDRAFT_182561 [Hyphopichia burtonii NRRL Y-1933]